MLLQNIGLFVFFIILLAVSASFCIRSLSKISRFLRFSEFIIGFVVMGFATSLPELFVGITSGLKGEPGLSLGNVIGSVIVNLTFVAGIVVLLARNIDTKQSAIRKDALKLVFISVIPVILMILGNRISRIDGAILLAIFLYHIYTLYKERKSYSATSEDHITRFSAIGNTLLFILFVVILFLSANMTVKYGTSLSLELGLPALFIGLFFVAIGTSLPELVFGIIAARSMHASMSLGDLFGASIINLTLVLGLTAVIHPIDAALGLFLTSSIFMILICFLVSTFVESGRMIDWREGIAMLFMYVFFLLVELSLSGYLGPR